MFVKGKGFYLFEKIESFSPFALLIIFATFVKIKYYALEIHRFKIEWNSK